jgi:RimJ/RimL family protein N-acetyltransferase
MGTRLLEDSVQLPIELTDDTGASFRVRALERGDRAALERMYDAFEPKRAAQGLPPRSPPEVQRWLERVLAAGDHLVVEMDGRLLGHVMLMPMDGDAVELANFLHQSVRNRGIGTHANAIALDVARAAGRRAVWLSVEPSNRAAVRSYEKVGFRRLPGSLWAPEIEMEVVLRRNGGPPGAHEPD